MESNMDIVERIVGEGPYIIVDEFRTLDENDEFVKPVTFKSLPDTKKRPKHNLDHIPFGIFEKYKVDIMKLSSHVSRYIRNNTKINYTKYGVNIIFHDNITPDTPRDTPMRLYPWFITLNTNQLTVYSRVDIIASECN